LQSSNKNETLKYLKNLPLAKREATAPLPTIPVPPATNATAP